LRRLIAVTVAVLAAASLSVAPGWVLAATSDPGGRDCRHGYAYAGYASRDGVHGIAATITSLGKPAVGSGHAAAWVGVGGIHAGRGGKSEWLQAGLAAFPRIGSRLYVESVSAAGRRRFVDVGRAVAGRRYRVAVVETKPGVWQASIGGRNLGRAIPLPTAHGSWRGIATSETWSAAHAGCSSYRYRFAGVSVLGSSGWIPLSAAETIGAPVDGGAAEFSAAA
jgi:hypothetical protein